MGLIAEIAISVGIGVHVSGQAELVGSADLAKFLQGVRTRRLRVLGLEGFRIVGSSLVPNMDAIADFSSIAQSASSEDTVDEALRFLSEVKGSDLLYEVTLTEDRK
jgi:hypothetical protein